MSLRFVADSQAIRGPLAITASPKSITIQNLGEFALEDLGVYVQPALDLGSVDQPADFPPATDYQDLLTWGTAVVTAVEVSGGLKITLPQTSGTNTVRVTRSAGARHSNRIALKTLAPGEIVSVTLELETPPGVTARRLYVNLVVD